jgi:hypothetical protein
MACAHRRTYDWRDLADGYHELEGCGQPLSLKYIAEELGIDRQDLVAVVSELEKIPSRWRVHRHGTHSSEIYIQST